MTLRFASAGAEGPSLSQRRSQTQDGLHVRGEQPAGEDGEQHLERVRRCWKGNGKEGKDFPSLKGLGVRSGFADTLVNEQADEACAESQEDKVDMARHGTLFKAAL